MPIDDWMHPAQPLAARQVSREIGPDADAMKALVAALSASKHPAFVVGPAVDRAEAVDLMVKVAEKAKAAVWVSPFSARCSFPERHPQFAGFLPPRPDKSRTPCATTISWSWSARRSSLSMSKAMPRSSTAPTAIFQITDDGNAAAYTPVGTSIIATMKPALSALLAALPESKRATPAGRKLAPAPAAADPIPVEYLMHALSQAMSDDMALVEEVPSHRPAMNKFMPMPGQDSFYTMASGGLGYGLPAAVGMALGRTRAAPSA